MSKSSLSPFSCNLITGMRAHLHSLARWLRLVLACLAVGAAVSPALVASAAEPVGVVQGGPGKKPVAVAQLVARFRPALALLLTVTPTAAVSGLVRATVPCASGLALFLLHRALLR